MRRFAHHSWLRRNNKLPLSLLLLSGTQWFWKSHWFCCRCFPLRNSLNGPFPLSANLVHCFMLLNPFVLTIREQTDPHRWLYDYLSLLSVADLIDQPEYPKSWVHSIRIRPIGWASHCRTEQYSSYFFVVVLTIGGFLGDDPISTLFMTFSDDCLLIEICYGLLKLVLCLRSNAIVLPSCNYVETKSLQKSHKRPHTWWQLCLLISYFIRWLQILVMIIQHCSIF